MILDFTSPLRHFFSQSSLFPQTKKSKEFRLVCLWWKVSPPKHVFLLLAAPGYLLMMKWMRARQAWIWNKMKSLLTEKCQTILSDSFSKQHLLVQFQRGLVFYGCLLMANSLPNCFDPKKANKSLNLIFNLWFGYFGSCNERTFPSSESKDRIARRPACGQCQASW